jgi:hypothetical protein
MDSEVAAGSNDAATAGIPPSPDSPGGIFRHMAFCRGGLGSSAGVRVALQNPTRLSGYVGVAHEFDCKYKYYIDPYYQIRGVGIRNTTPDNVRSVFSRQYWSASF